MANPAAVRHHAPWRDAAWLAQAHAWIREALGGEPAGAIEQTHVQAWSTVLRVPTADGDVWFKANAPGTRHEAALVSLLSRRRAELVPPLLASDLERGWMLMADAGTRLRELITTPSDFDRWLDVLPRYAELQQALVGDAEELVALGVPDLRLATLPERYERMLEELPGDVSRYRAAVPRVRELCDELAAYGIPETIQHDDLHDGQVYVRDGRYRVIDWGDAVVSHPFFTLSVTLEGVIQWGLDDIEGSVDTVPFRDAYLGAFDRGRGLVPAAEAALRLGWAARAVSAHAAGSEEPERHHARLRMFLDGRP